MREHGVLIEIQQAQKKGDNVEYLPANAISGRPGGGNDDETFAAAKNVILFLNICAKQLAVKLIVDKAVDERAARSKQILCCR